MTLSESRYLPNGEWATNGSHVTSDIAGDHDTFMI